MPDVPTKTEKRFQQWAGTGWPKGWAKAFNIPDLPETGTLWPIVDTHAGHVIDGYPTHEQWFCVAFTSQHQALLHRLLNENHARHAQG